MGRLTNEMNLGQCILALSSNLGGSTSPDACWACVELLLAYPKVLPIAQPSWLLYGRALLLVDSLEIYGDRLYMLWNDVCGRDAGKVVGLLRAWQLGVGGVTRDVLYWAIDHRGDGIDLDAVMVAVKERLPDFDPRAAL